MSWRFLPPGRERRLSYDRERRHDLRLRREVPYVDIPYIRLPSQNGLSLKSLICNSICEVIERGCSSFCVICQDTINYKQIYRKLICTHQFHQNCIDKWFIDNTTCPLCKQNLNWN